MVIAQPDDPRHLCVPQLVEVQAAATPDAVALVAGDGVLTYRELNIRANQIAHHLRMLGVGPDVLVGLCLERSAEMVAGALAILKAGGAYVPLDPAYPAERLAFILHDARAPVLVTRQHLAAGLPGMACQVVALDTDAPRLACAPTSPVAGGVTPAHLAYVIYTSGSTGQPKGVQITHGSLLNLVCWHQRAFAVTAADRATQLASPAFDAAVWELWPYLTAGACIYVPDEETRAAPALLRDWLVAHEITLSFLPTALAESVMALEWPPETALRVLLTGADTLQRYPSPALPFSVVNNYGPTECTVVATSGRVAPAARPGERPSIGRPIANTRVYILDAGLQPVAPGVSGELYIGGIGLARGYLNRPALTAEKFIPDPFSDDPGARLYRTGDRACYLPDGQIAFLGRVDDQIKIRGYRIEPDEVIAVLNQHEAVRAGVVIAREDVPGEKRLVAYLVLHPGARPSASSLRDVVAARLPDYMVPTAFVRLDALPLTANGKVDRGALPAPDATNVIRDDAIEVPRTPVEERLAEIVSMLLGIEQLSTTDNFFMLGGHSLLGTQLIAKVRERFGVEITLRSLFEAPTITTLASAIEGLIIARIEALAEEDVQSIRA